MKKQLYLLFLLVPFFINAQNVGIGTSTPQAKVHIAHISSAANPSVLIFDSTYKSMGKMQFKNSDYPSKYIQFNGYKPLPFSSESYLNIESDSTNIATFSGNGSVGIGGGVDDKAVLNIFSNTKGVLIPRLTDVQRNAIVNPPLGLLVYQKDTGAIELPGLFEFNGTYWRNITNGLWSVSGSEIVSNGLTDVRTAKDLFINGHLQLYGHNGGPQGGIYKDGVTWLHDYGLNGNVFLGTDAGNLTLDYTVATKNIGIGDSALANLTTGIQNIGVGYKALRKNTGGIFNHALGAYALYANTSGSENFGIGNSALTFNTSGNSNIAVGNGASYNNTNASNNLAIGNFTLFNNKTAKGIVAIGDSALNKYNSTSVAYVGNTAIGYRALYSNLTGLSNTAIGWESGTKSTGTNNTLLGSGALRNNTSGNDNVIIGASANSNNATGSNNTIIGSQAGAFYVDNKSGNVLIGYRAGYKELSSNKLYIHNNEGTSLEALIYGEFDNALLRINGSTEHNGFTQLGKTTDGAPSVKMKELTVNTAGSQGISTFVAHGVTASKIISLSALVTVGSFQILPNHSQTGFQYWCNVDGGNIAITTVSGNSAGILNLPVKILITYKE
jgi:hypothetical protein